MLYQVILEHACALEIGEYETYGIAVTDRGKAIRIISDITPDQQQASTLAERFNREQLSPEHLDQAVEDFLYDFIV